MIDFRLVYYCIRIFLVYADFANLCERPAGHPVCGRARGRVATNRKGLAARQERHGGQGQ